MPKALQNVILRDANGEEYRLVAGEKAPALPEHLALVAEESGYIEKRAAPAERPAAASSRKKEGK